MRKTLKFKWTVSRGRDTYGYNICSLWIDGQKVSSCNGGGYDMQGTALANWMEDEFQEQIRKLQAHYGSGDNNKGFYGLSFYNAKTHKSQHRFSKHVDRACLTGACGFSSIEEILNAIGYKLEYIHGEKDITIYLLIDA